MTALAIGAFVVFRIASPPEAEVAAATPALTPATSSPEAAALGTPFGRLVDARPTFCIGGVLECEMLSVPASQAEPRADGDTVQVRFGLHAADPDRRIGTLVIATGGPGSSGIELSEGYLELFSDAVKDRYDIVFFDQRGVGRSLTLGCHQASGDEPRWADLADTGNAGLREAEAWVDACLSEAGVTDTAELDRYGTYQAAADLDAYLDHIGAGRVHLFGESYGTLLVQRYAAHRPDRVAGLILDAVIDPDVSAGDAAIEQAIAFGAVLDDVLASCDDDDLCADDFGTVTAIQAWDDLATTLAEGPVAVTVPTRGGRTHPIELTTNDLVNTAALLLYTEADRSYLLRLLASAASGDLQPLARASALAAGRDPETGSQLLGIEDSANFHAIRCQEYADAEEAAGVAESVSGLGPEGGRMITIAMSDLACAAGFAGVEPEPPLPDASGDYPVLVLTSTADPATPHQWALDVAERLDNAYLIVTQDGSHGTYGWGLPCPDDLVKEFLVYGDLPGEQTTECEGYLTDWYQPRALGGPDAYADVLDALVAVEQEVLWLPDYYFWDGRPQRIGCPHGGWMGMTWTGDDEFELNDCAILPGWPLTGSIIVRPDGSTRMSLTVPNGHLEYRITDSYTVSVEGELDGVEVDLSR